MGIYGYAYGYRFHLLFYLPTPMLDAIEQKVNSGERLNFNDGMALFASHDLLRIGRLANSVREKLHGNITYYNINRHINPTNYCVYNCGFCAFKKNPGEEGGYEFSLDEIAHRAAGAVAQGATELHIVGGLHHKWKYQQYVDIIRVCHEAAPKIHLKAYTAVEIDFLSRISKQSIHKTLEDLQAAGLGSLPGGGAEILGEETRKLICDKKSDAGKWIEVHRVAHQMGIKSNCTMLYGHVENTADKVRHLISLRQLEDEAQGFNCFIPLAFHPDNTKLSHIRKPGGIADLKTLAISRLMLDNISNVKAYWITLGLKIAQVAQHYGANDMDGTVVEEKIYHMAGSDTPEEVSVQHLRSLILETGREPRERDTLYQNVHREPVLA